MKRDVRKREMTYFEGVLKERFACIMKRLGI